MTSWVHQPYANCARVDPSCPGPMSVFLRRRRGRHRWVWTFITRTIDIRWLMAVLSGPSAHWSPGDVTSSTTTKLTLRRCRGIQTRVWSVVHQPEVIVWRPFSVSVSKSGMNCLSHNSIHNFKAYYCRHFIYSMAF